MNLLTKLAEQGNPTPTTTDPRRNPGVNMKNFQGVDSDGSFNSTASSSVTSPENGTEYSSSLKED